MTPRRASDLGFTLVEVLVACALLVLLLTLGVPMWRGQDLRVGRMDAVEALTRVQQAQEQFRNAHGLYAGDLGALLGTAPRSTQGRYAITLALEGPEAYRATASALGPQAQDAPCATLTLQVRTGFAQTGPDAACWLR